jgi:hypothetical protein
VDSRAGLDIIIIIIIIRDPFVDCLCGLVTRVPGYRSRGPSSIPGLRPWSFSFSYIANC